MLLRNGDFTAVYGVVEQRLQRRVEMRGGDVRLHTVQFHEAAGHRFDKLFDTIMLGHCTSLHNVRV
jgi:hypothetical protein